MVESRSLRWLLSLIAFLLLLSGRQESEAGHKKAARARMSKSEVARSQNRDTSGKFVPGRRLTAREQRSLQAKMQTRTHEGKFDSGFETFPWVEITEIKPGDVLTIWGQFTTVRSVRHRKDLVEITYRDPADGLVKMAEYGKRRINGEVNELLVRKTGKGSTRAPRTNQQIQWYRKAAKAKAPQ